MLIGSLQESLLVLLCYDKQRAPTIRNLLDPALFGGFYRDIGRRIYDHIDRFKTPPGDHIADLLVDKLESENRREVTLYTDIVESIHAAKDNINAEFVMSQLETFIRRQSLRSIAIDLAKELQRDTEESLGRAEALIAGAGQTALSVFDPGTRLSDKRKALSFLDISNAALPTGIPELDKRGFGPTKKELWLFIGNTKAGKTWALIHLAKMALMHRQRVCHITLEMSEARCAQRYYQALFAIAKRKETFNTTRFKKNALHQLEGFEDVRVTPKLAMDDPQIRKKLEKHIDRWGLRMLDNIVIKQFPTGNLSLGQLEAYLDNLSTTERFDPDLLIVDYPDLMKLDADNFRLALDALYKGLRGIAVSRNTAVAVVSQSHRAAAKAKVVGADNVAEAYSKIAHADTIITYTQTPQEQQMGLARLFVAGGRNDSDKCTIAISQQYGIGGFALDSALMRSAYWANIASSVGSTSEDE